MRKPALRFPATIRILGINPYVEVSKRRAAQLQENWRRPMPVLVRVDGKPARKPWRINMMPAGDGGFLLYLHKSVREASRTRVGDRVTVELEFDSGYRSGPMHPMPRWFSTALRDNPGAKLNWSRLTPSRRKEILRYFAGLKSDAARQRNLARAMLALSGAAVRFMARSWSDGK
ncbi:MAG TPA: YdeI/OmpD-associated family protein [Steroidobacteraceae bacterium]|nr:YdeI/OmpD-associated family protein [Steroidobacteraceae bacterium]